MSTGWWKGRAPVNTDSVVVVGSLCTCLFGGFIYINRVKQSKSFRTQWVQSVKLILVIASLYCVWCASQLYLRNPPQPAVGEEHYTYPVGKHNTHSAGEGRHLLGFRIHVADLAV